MVASTQVAPSLAQPQWAPKLVRPPTPSLTLPQLTHPHAPRHAPTLTGAGKNVNVGLFGPPKGDGDYISVWHQILMPMAYEYNPQLVIVSAGFDAALGDPLGGYRVTPTGYAHLTHMLRGLAGGRLVVVLEGGYNLSSISQSMAEVARVVLGDRPPAFDAPVVAHPTTKESIDATREAHTPHWACFGGAAAAAAAADDSVAAETGSLAAIGLAGEGDEEQAAPVTEDSMPVSNN